MRVRFEESIVGSGFDYVFSHSHDSTPFCIDLTLRLVHGCYSRLICAGYIIDVPDIVCVGAFVLLLMYNATTTTSVYKYRFVESKKRGI